MCTDGACHHVGRRRQSGRQPRTDICFNREEAPGAVRVLVGARSWKQLFPGVVASLGATSGSCCWWKPPLIVSGRQPQQEELVPGAVVCETLNNSTGICPFHELSVEMCSLQPPLATAGRRSGWVDQMAPTSSSCQAFSFAGGCFPPWAR